MQKKKKEIYSQIIMLGLALFMTVVAFRESNQSIMAHLMPIAWTGEYSYDGQNWEMLTENTKLTTDQKNVTLRIQTNFDIPSGGIFSFFLNHIHMDIYRDGRKVFETSAEHPQIGEDMCGKQWCAYVSDGITKEDVLEIQLHNPHRGGNPTAYCDFLQNSYVASNAMVAIGLAKKYNIWRYVGIVYMASALVLLGIYTATLLMRMSYGQKICLLGIVSFFMGGYIYLDNCDTLLRMESVIFNTYALYFCKMFAVYGTLSFVVLHLTNHRQKIAGAVRTITMLTNVACMMAAFLFNIKLFDTFFIWLIVQGIAIVIVVACGILQLKENVEGKGVYFSAILLLAAIEIEIWNTFGGWWMQGSLVKILFTVLFGLHLLRTIRDVPRNYRAAIEAEELEKELHRNRNVLALSQIRTHFIFNVLNAISGMCKYAPEKADETVICFARYLRRNINILEKDELVRFEHELKHVEDYVKLEQIRFGDKIRFVEEIEFQNFSLPPLILQPIVENAIKHGLASKSNGGTICIKTTSTEDMVIITVCDDGIGYDTKEEKQRKYREGNGVALENVKFRLKHMANGTLHIESNTDAGTMVRIKIPKEGHS